MKDYIQAGPITFVADYDDLDAILHENATWCPKCQSAVRVGDWPAGWCRGKREDHARPHYGWHFALKP